MSTLLPDAVERVFRHCEVLEQLGTQPEIVAEIRLVGQRFTEHFRQLDRLRSRIAQVAERLERP